MLSYSDRETLFPYPSFAGVKIRTNEPMAASYFNSHIVRLLSNVKATENSHTLQKASDKQWGLVKLAETKDITDGSGNRNAALTNDVLNRAMDELRRRNKISFSSSGRLSFTKNFEFQRGEFNVGSEERIAKKITSTPNRVVFAHVYFIPYGFDGHPFYSAKTTTAPSSAFYSNIESSGIVNFADWKAPEGYTEFHVYYHNSGYVICENGKYNDAQKSVKVCWTLLVKKN